MPTRILLSRGSTDTEAIRELQQILNTKGAELKVDGDFGGRTEIALKEYQTSHGLPATGETDTASWALLDRLPFGTDPTYQGIPMSPKDPVEGSENVATAWNTYGNLLSVLADVLNLDPSVACAVIAVESAGTGFQNHRMIIRFENHVFKKQWGPDHTEVFDQHFKTAPTQTWKEHQWRNSPSKIWRTLHTKAAGQDEEWEAFLFACTLDHDAAIKSISMGAPQIMGFNYDKIGFNSPGEMFTAFSMEESSHILGLFDFIRSDHLMVRALRNRDWTGFAAIYNGSGQATTYGKWLDNSVKTAQTLGIS